MAGRYRTVHCDDRTLAYLREDAAGSILVVLNLAGEAIPLPARAAALADAVLLSTHLDVLAGSTSPAALRGDEGLVLTTRS